MSATELRPKVHIGEVIRNAVVFDFKRYATVDKKSLDDMNFDSLLRAVEKLFALLDERKIDYVLVGGIAMLQYVEGRNTEDIDLIMAVDAIEDMPEIEIEEQNAYFARGHFDTLQIDLLLTENQLFEKVRKGYATKADFVERSISCATVEGLILLKLYALPSLYRQGSFAKVGIYENDVATLIQGHNPDLPMLVQELGSYLPENDMVEVRSIVEDIQKRLDRFDQNR